MEQSCTLRIDAGDGHDSILKPFSNQVLVWQWGDKHYFLDCQDFAAFCIAIFKLSAYQWLFPGMQDQVAETFEQFKNMPNIPTESLSAMDSVMANYSHILFFVSFIKDMIVGLVAVAIINSSISQPNDIFKDSEDELQ